jgi:hypothetical protein
MKGDIVARVLSYAGKYHALSKLRKPNLCKTRVERRIVANLPFHPVWAHMNIQHHIDRVRALYGPALFSANFNADLKCCWHMCDPPLFRRLRTLEVGWGGGGVRGV